MVIEFAAPMNVKDTFVPIKLTVNNINQLSK